MASRFGRSPSSLRAAALGLAVLAASGQVAALGQEEERRIERALRTADPSYRLRVDTSLGINERAYVDVGGYFTFTGLTLNDDADNSRRMLQYDTTLYGQASLDGSHTVFGRARFRYRDFSEGDSFDGRGDRWVEPFLDRYWYEFDLRRAVAAYEGRSIAGNLNVRAGRQFVDWGAGLALSEVLYAVRPVVSWNDRVLIEGLFGVTPGDESIVDFDASRDEYNRDTKRGFFGGMLRGVTATGHELYLFGLHMEDYNTDTTARFGVAEPVDFTYDATYWGIGARGALSPSLLYLGEFVYQLGDNRSDPIRGPQTSEQIRAFAGRAQLTYLLRDVNQTRLELETLFASGDSDRLNTSDTVGGNLSGTTDHAFNSLGFVNTGLAFAPSLSNILTVRAGASTFPFRQVPAFDRLQIGADVIALSKFDEDAPIDEPTKGNMLLGLETDVFMNYRVTSDFALNVRYGAFFPGPAIVGERDVRHFFLFSATLSF